MFHLHTLFHRKELATSHNRSSEGRDLVESHARRQCTSPPSTDKKLKKLLINVNIQRSFGPVHVIISVENTVGDLIKAAIGIYLKEKRRPLLMDTDACCFDLHYSQFSLECLKPEEKLTNLDSRNFFLCPKPTNINTNTDSAASKASCSNEANTTAADIHAEDLLFPYTKFMDFLL